MTQLSLLASLLLVAVTVAAASSASAATTKQCEDQATNCLGGCAGIDISTTAGNQQYGRCVTKCDGRRTACLDGASDAAKNMSIGTGSTPPKNKAGVATPPGSLLESGGPTVSPGDSGKPSRAGTIKSQTIAPTSPTGPAMGTR
jgi:hypothetical protein